MINFGNLINRLSALDGKHWLEIRRRVGNEEVSVYPLPVRCWATLRSADNPDGLTAFAQPVVTSLEIRTFPEIDIRNGDFLVVQKTKPDGTQIGKPMGGQCGNPFPYEPFQLVHVELRTLGGEVTPPTPPPLVTESFIHVHFLNEEHIQIHPTITHRAVIGEPLEIPYLALDGLDFDHIVMNGERIDANIIEFIPREQAYSITFFYVGSKQDTAIQVLVNSAFRRANGTTGIGFHLHERIPLLRPAQEQGGLTLLEPEMLRFSHSSTFRNINISTQFNNTNSNILATYPSMSWWKVDSVAGGVVSVYPYTPTEQEKNAYVYMF